MKRNRRRGTSCALGSHTAHSTRFVLVVGLLLTSMLAAGCAPSWPWQQHVSAPSGTATDGPGVLSYALPREGCVGTARNSSSKVWFTLAQGALAGVYYPTIDNGDVESLQYVVSDGHSFSDLQARDTTFTVRLLDARALACEVTATAKNGKYRIVTDYFTDPARNTLLMRAQFTPLAGSLSSYSLYVRYNPGINRRSGGGKGNIGGNTGTVDTSTGHDILIATGPGVNNPKIKRTYATTVYSALDAAPAFSAVSNGFAEQASDSLTQVDKDRHLSATYGTAANGNVIQTGQVDLSKNGQFTLALGFGGKQSDAVSAATGSLGGSVDQILSAYEKDWHAYDAGLFAPPGSFAGVDGATWGKLVDEYYLCANVVKTSEDKTFPGAIIPGLTAPFAQSLPASDNTLSFFDAYSEPFARDLYESWTGLIADNDLATARAAVLFLFDSQQLPFGAVPRNSLLNGQLAPDSNGIQLDEVSYPIIMAAQLGMGDATLYPHIRAAADYLISRGPSSGPERWEEQLGYSPSTIAAEIAALVAAAQIAQANGDTASAAVWRGVADDWQRSVKSWTVTSTGPFASHPYFIRLSKNGDPNAATSYNLGSGGPTVDQRSVVDAGFLELVRLGDLQAMDDAVRESLPVVDAKIMVTTDNGPSWHRYNGDGWGDDAATGRPWPPTLTGTGHVWPLLDAERAEYDLATGDASTALSLLETMQRFGGGVGLLSEEVWDSQDIPASPYGTDPAVASIGFVNGQPTGGAIPLTWASGAYVRLMRDILANAVLDRPGPSSARYLTQAPGQTSLQLTSAAPAGSAGGNRTVQVGGITASGNAIAIAVTDVDANTQTNAAGFSTGPGGSFTASVPAGCGNLVVNVVATSPSGATAHIQQTLPPC